MEIKKTLVIGASDNPSRYSYLAIEKLLKHNHPVVAIGRKNTEVLGVNITKEMINHENVNTITLYVNPTNQVEYYDYILNTNPNRVIFNPGTENPDLYKKLQDNKIEFEEACTLVLLGTNQY